MKTGSNFLVKSGRTNGNVTMQVIEYPTAAEFLDTTHTMLLENEAANELILSYAVSQTNGVENTMSTTFYCVVDNDTPLLTTMYTPDIWHQLPA